MKLPNVYENSQVPSAQVLYSFPFTLTTTGRFAYSVGSVAGVVWQVKIYSPTAFPKKIFMFFFFQIGYANII